MKPRVIVVCSDQHCGSQLGLITPEGVQTSDSNWFKPGKSLQWLWGQHLNYVDDAERIVKAWRKKGATAHYVNLGDTTDSDHHGTHQIIGRDLGTHIQAARNVLREGFLRLQFDTVHFIGGTPAHVGPGAALEKTIASDLASEFPIVRDPRTGFTVWPDMTAQIGAYRFDFKHHGRAGTREHTRKSYQAIYAYDIHGAYVNDGRTAPDVAVRAHNHKMGDSGPDLRGVTRVFTSGCWQFSSEWVKSKAIESRPDFGGWIFVVTDDMRGPYDLWVRPFRYEMDNADDANGIWTP
jgi:hypothetical protein